MKITNLIFLFFLLSVSLVYPQSKKFGKVSKLELKESTCTLDSTANASILYKERKSHFDFRKESGFILVEDYFIRIKIYNKEGFDWATYSIPIYHNGRASEKVTKLKAYTFNLDHGKIIKTQLSKKNIFKEKTNKFYDQKKFTMPNIKPGSVIDIKYTFETPFTEEMNDFIIQEDIPTKEVFFKINIPEFYGYRPLVKGYLPINIDQSIHEKSLTFFEIARSGGEGLSTVQHSTNAYEINYQEIVYKINKTNIPALKDEPYSGNINNYRSAVLMELLYLKFPNQPKKILSATWEDVAKETFRHPKFGPQLKKNNYLKNDLKAFINLPEQEKLKKIFEFIKNKIKWNKEYGYLVDKGVAKAYKNGIGNVAEVNLNLINMLNAAGLDASPVLISTVNHGIPLFPTRTGFNYVIAAVKTPNGLTLLDATDKNSISNVLPERDLNFQGRLIHKNGDSEEIYLFPDFYSNKVRNINVNFTTEEELEGFFIDQTDNYFAMQKRNSIETIAKEEIEKWFEEKYPELEITTSRIKNIENIYKPIKETVKFETDNFVEEIGDKIYLLPLLTWRFESNPFKSKERKFPVFLNFPHVISNTVNLSIPDNFIIEKIPLNTSYNFTDKDGGILGTYDYKITQNNNKLTIKSIYNINMSIIPEENYKNLKNFMEQVVNKQNEKIILTKK